MKRSRPVYHVEYSSDAVHFATAGTKNASLGGAVNSYNFTHENAAKIASKLFYRLRIVSANGSFKYSDIIIVRFGKQVDLITDVYPNPTTGIVHVISGAHPGGTIRISISDLSGRILEKRSVAEHSNYVLDLSAYAKGMYILEATANAASKQVFKLIKK